MWLLLLLLSTGGFFGGSTWIWLKFCSIFKPKVILGEVFEAFLNTINFLRIFFQIFGDFPKKKLFFSSFLPKFSRKIRFFFHPKITFFFARNLMILEDFSDFFKISALFLLKVFLSIFLFFLQKIPFLSRKM